MASDYNSIRIDNERRYGTDIARIGPMLLADRYDDRTHFIFELLQNAEDALARRKGWTGSRSVRFHLANNELRVSHFGQPFTEADVRGICGIAESTKGTTAIGRFGIGFKSVYAYTERPAIHSGAENFAIENFVWPRAEAVIQRNPDETVIVLPFWLAAASAQVTTAFQRLGPGTLLFLRHINEIEWTAPTGHEGGYRRSQEEEIDPGVRRLGVVGREARGPTKEENWLVFSEPVDGADGGPNGCVEIAFSVRRSERKKRDEVVPVSRSPLVVFFPTVVETHLGFWVQGPYRTTPSRDNVPHGDMWNRRCVEYTAVLLARALRWLREHDMLDADALRCLPLESAKFAQGSMFAPLFERTKRVLTEERLLPRFGGGHVAARTAKLARTQDLRELFDGRQVAVLFGVDDDPSWLSSEISQDRTPEVYKYLARELNVTEVTPEMILSKVDLAFLEAQEDRWIVRLYEYLNGQPALCKRLDGRPWIRLANGKHVAAEAGQPQAFLPGQIETSFPTVRAAVCATPAASAFLRSLGLTEPDPVDDVVRNVLSGYRDGKSQVRDTTYERDLLRIFEAFKTDSHAQREKLLAALQKSAFVRAVDAGTGVKSMVRPGDVYMATDRLKSLFAGVAGVLLVDDDCSCLRGRDARELLEACGVTRYLQPVSVPSRFHWQELAQMRKKEGAENNTGTEEIEDSTLRGLDALLQFMPTLGSEVSSKRAALLWEALCELEDRRSGTFSGTYQWFYVRERTCRFDATFVYRLNTTAWVPDDKGQLQRPEFVVFDTLRWRESVFLRSKIRFKPPILEALAKEAGIDSAVLILLKELGLTSETELKRRLGLREMSEPPKLDAAQAPRATPGSTGIIENDGPLVDPNRTGAPAAAVGPGKDGTPGGSNGSAGGGAGTANKPGGVEGAEPQERQFVSYVALHPEAAESLTDGLDHEARMALEEKAISFILAQERRLRRTPKQNPGYDLFEAGADGRLVRWVEVKAMSGSLAERPVGLSRTQFEYAQRHGRSYWLYIVEHAGVEHAARILRIRDPAGRSQTFTFDRGWEAVAEVDEPRKVN